MVARALARAGSKASKPKFKAERKVRKDVKEKLEKQEAAVKASDKAKKAGKKPKGAPVEGGRRARSPAVDKPKVDKKDTRVANAGDSLTNANKKSIKDAPSTQALTSLKSKINKEISSLKNITDAEKKTRKVKLADAISKRKEEIRKVAADAAKPKKPDTRPAPKKPQSADERAQAGFGNVRTVGTTQRNKKEGVGMMSSYTSMSRADAIVKAGKDLRSGKITQAEYNRIMKAIDRKDDRENLSQAAKRTGAKKVSLPKPLVGAEPVTGAGRAAMRGMKEGGLAKPSASQAGIKKLPTAVRNKMGYMKKGGAVKPKSTDMRKGGMFY